MTKMIRTKAKVAMIREPGYPVGVPAPCYLRCPCGAKPSTVPGGATVTCHQCGTTYTSTGWVTGG